MEWNIAFLGTVGAGKTTAIRSVSDIDVVDTDVNASDRETKDLKATTTVALDMGVIDLDHGDKLRLHGAPGQERFDFMWEILVSQSRGAIIFVDHRRPEPLADLAMYMAAIRKHRPKEEFPVVVAVTHSDGDPKRDLSVYRDHFAQGTVCACSLCRPPVFWCDARNPQDVMVLLIVTTAILESFDQFPIAQMQGRALHYVTKTV